MSAVGFDFSRVEAGEAVLSDDRRYRYTLTRIWDESRPRMVFIGLNPSTADEKRLDPTLRRVVRFADGFGFGSFVMLNLFALRATDPMVMRAAHDPVGPLNDRYLLDETFNRTVVCGWGTHGTHRGRDQAVLAVLKEHDCAVHALKLTQGGHPSHPLYLPSNSELIAFP